MSDTADDTSEARRRAALGAYGAMRFMRRIQGGVEDVEGAVARGQFGAAASMARSVTLLCLSICSMSQGAPIDLDEESIAFDAFANVPADQVAAALALAGAALDLDAASAPTWLECFIGFVAETERLLGNDGRLPLLRSPEGAFAMIRLARRWAPILAQLELPSLLPDRWTIPAGPSSGRQA